MSRRPRRLARPARARRSRSPAGCAVCSGPGRAGDLSARGSARPPSQTRRRIEPAASRDAVVLAGVSVCVGPVFTRLAGLPIAERVLRAAFRAGYARIFCGRRYGLARSAAAAIVAHELGSTVDVSRSARLGVRVRSRRPADNVTVVGAGTVVSPALLAKARGLRGRRDESVDVPAGRDWPESGVLRLPRPTPVISTCCGRTAVPARAPRRDAVRVEVSLGLGRYWRCASLVGPAFRRRRDDPARKL